MKKLILLLGLVVMPCLQAADLLEEELAGLEGKLNMANELFSHIRSPRRRGGGYYKMIQITLSAIHGAQRGESPFTTEDLAGLANGIDHTITLMTKEGVNFDAIFMGNIRDQTTGGPVTIQQAIDQVIPPIMQYIDEIMEHREEDATEK